MSNTIGNKPVTSKPQEFKKDVGTASLKKQSTDSKPQNIADTGKKEVPSDHDTISVSRGGGKNETPAEVKNHKKLSDMKNTWDVQSDRAIAEAVNNAINEKVKSDKKDLSPVLDAPEAGLKTGGKAFGKFESSGANEKGEKDDQIKNYKDPGEGKEDIKQQWEESKETDQSRVYKETHGLMENLHGQDKSGEKVDNADGSHTEKTYETTHKKIGEETELSFKEDHKSTGKDGKEDVSSSITKRNPDGTYNKAYERTDKDGNKYKTELNTKFDGSSERKSETVMKDGTKITSSEINEADGDKKTISDEVRPDGTKIHKEVTVDVNGKEKVIDKVLKPDGTVVDKGEKVDPVKQEDRKPQRAVSNDEKGTTDQSRVYKETHGVMEKLQGQDKSGEKVDNADGSHTEKTYETTQKKVGDGTELSFKEDHKSTGKDGKEDVSSSITKRNPDGTYNKAYERTDKDGNKYKTELDTKFDGSSERKSETVMKDGTKITSTESTDGKGNKKIISDEIKPDGTKVHKEVTVDSKEKVDKPPGDDKPIKDQKPPEIDKSKLTATDKTIINALHLENMQPGDKMKLSAKVLADLGLGEEVFGEGADVSIECGSNVQYTLERDKKNPNCYRITGGAEALLGVKAGASLVAAGESARADLVSGGSVTLQMDFSKKGEATNTALYAVRSALQSGNAPITMLDKLDSVAEGLGADLLPGDSTGKFLSDHFKSLKVEGGITGELGAKLALGLGLDSKLLAELSAGGRLERQIDPQTGKTTSWDVTGFLAGSAALNYDKFLPLIGPDVLRLQSNQANIQGKLALEETTHIPVGEDGKLDLDKMNSDIALKVNLGAEADILNGIKTNGFELEGSASINNILTLPSIPAEYREQMKEAYEKKDYAKFQDLCVKVLPDIKLSGKLETFERTNMAIKGKVSGKEGVGGGVEGTAGMDYIATQSSDEGNITLDAKGLHTKGAHYEHGIKDDNENKAYDMTWEEILRTVQEAPDIVDTGV